MEDSILNSIKKLLGLEPGQDYYDEEIILNINTIFSTLRQNGINKDKVYNITNKEDKWIDYLNDIEKYSMVKTYVYLKVKQYFDPSLSSAVMQAQKEQIDELEFRLNIQSNIDERENK